MSAPTTIFMKPSVSPFSTALPTRVIGRVPTIALRPDARLLVFSTKPSTARWDKWPAIQDLNARVAKWCDGTPWAEYVDTVPVSLGPDGLPRKDLLQKDGLHLNREGYRLWAEVLRRHAP